VRFLHKNRLRIDSLSEKHEFGKTFRFLFLYYINELALLLSFWGAQLVEEKGDLRIDENSILFYLNYDSLDFKNGPIWFTA
jgi:hypothetical protein